jgi:tRNA pseudouridine32 synthase/23S rRNA pseudouridine746 synthase
VPVAPFTIIYQDDQLLALDKPSGLLAVPGRGPDLQDCLSARVRQQFPTAAIVHRLDRDTSGVMLMALDAESHRHLGRQFEERTVAKRYIAVVFGVPTENEGTIDLPMRKDFDRPPRHCIDLEQGRSAITGWRVVERSNDRARLTVVPLTGRSHQIRLHLATIGNPILGDNLYAHAAAHQMATRLMLHAEMLSIEHPLMGKRLELTSPCPF